MMIVFRSTFRFFDNVVFACGQLLSNESNQSR